MVYDDIIRSIMSVHILSLNDDIDGVSFKNEIEESLIEKSKKHNTACNIIKLLLQNKDKFKEVNRITTLNRVAIAVKQIETTSTTKDNNEKNV